MSYARTRNIAVLLCTLWPWVNLPGQNIPRIELRLKGIFPVQGQSVAGLVVQVPVKCDRRGNLFLRHYRPTDFDRGPIVRISSDGAAADTIDIGSVPGFEKGSFFDFAVAPNGEMFLLAAKDIAGRHVLRFDADGKYSSGFELGPDIEAQQLAVFPAGEILISGNYKNPNGATEPLLSLYDRSGRFLREVSLPRDVRQGLEQDGAGSVADMVFLSNMVSSDDGNVYIMRPTAEPLVFVVSADGTVLHRFNVRSPGTDYRPIALYASGGRLLIEFVGEKAEGSTNQPRLYTLLSAEDGVRLADYLPAKDKSGILSCFGPQGLSFLRSDQNGLVIVHATP